MINVDQAVSIAWDYCINLYKGKISDLTLEEIELQEDKHWLITLSYSVPEAIDPSLDYASAVFIPKKFRKDYKVFKIDADTGVVISMKIRRI